MIELAPHHKYGLPLPNPVLIGSGFGGYGEAYQRLIDLTAFGAVVTNPITLRPRRSPSRSRLAETKAGFILDSRQENPGVRKVIQQYRKIWGRSDVAVIAHLPADEPNDLRRTAGALAGTESVEAIELGVPSSAAPADIKRWITAIGEGCMLPLLVKLPLAGVIEMAEIVAATAADALVIAGPPVGAALSPRTGEIVTGYMYGPATHSLILDALLTIKGLVSLPLIAAGGIHSKADVQAFLQAGASAVQLDSLLFVDPQAGYEIAAAFK
jgi:dihydroorotate dehydrogenase (NAD+) catalytic subunit